MEKKYKDPPDPLLNINGESPYDLMRRRGQVPKEFQVEADKSRAVSSDTSELESENTGLKPLFPELKAAQELSWRLDGW